MNNDFQAYNFGLDDPRIDFLWDSDYSSVHVSVATKPGTEKDFIEESIQNAKNSVLEEGVSRFDILQKVNDPTQFQLLEVYNNRGGGIAHKDTDHYKKWRANVADMMALDRRAATYRPLFPVPSEWTTDSKAAETAPAAGQSLFVAITAIKLKDRFDDSRFIGNTLYLCEKALIEEPQCRRFDLLQNVEDNNDLIMLKVYDDEAAYKAHFDTEHKQEWDEEVQILTFGTDCTTTWRTVFPAAPFWTWDKEVAAQRDVDLDYLDMLFQQDKDEGPRVTTAETYKLKEYGIKDDQ